MKTILLDTNFLLIPWQFGVDIFSEIDRICNFEYELVVPSFVIKELEKILNSGSGEDKAAAKLGLQLLKNKNIRITKEPQKVFKGVDDFLFAAAVEKRCIVATADKELRKRLKKVRVPMIVLRQKQYLQLIQ